MAFLVHAPVSGNRINPDLLLRLAGHVPVIWFDPDKPYLGGLVCSSPLAIVRRLKRGANLEYLLVGRVRLDRREELFAQIGDASFKSPSNISDADMCLLAYAKWGEAAIERIHGDFAFVIWDRVAQECLCARDRFGVRTLAWFEKENCYWIAGSMQDLAAAPGFHAHEFDPVWAADFLRIGSCEDPSRSIYSGVRRLAPAYYWKITPNNSSIRRYWSLEINEPLLDCSPGAIVDEFHAKLGAAVQDRLPPGRVGILMSGGLDSTTLAAKVIELRKDPKTVVVRTWLAGGDADPEAHASGCVVDFLGIEQTKVDAEGLFVEPGWQERPGIWPEPTLRAVHTAARKNQAKAMHTQADCWFYGEGPDNALTFEWQMHLRWLIRNNHWSRLLPTIASYVGTKSVSEWMTTINTRLFGHAADVRINLQPAWVRGSLDQEESQSGRDWRPEAHRNLSSALWPNLFEALDSEYAPMGVDWRHPYMDLRVLEFLVQTPPIPWGRRKLLIREAMKGRLPNQTLSRSKSAAHRDILAEQLRMHLPSMPRKGNEIEQFVDIGKLPKDPANHSDVYALTRVAILDHWLTTRHG